jgi:CDP-diacylglycerol---glycerol-3-phosphate 3-phosphatidyltransferase
LLEKRFWRKVLHANRASYAETSPGIELNEWEKDDWTYHAKGTNLPSPLATAYPNRRLGIWYRTTWTAPPEFTLFGSTNLNSRSANLDTELSFLMHTSSSALREQLDAEVQNLRTGAHRVDEKNWRRSDRNVRLGTRALVACGVKGML